MRWTIGKKQDVPVISYFSGFLANILEFMPFIDIWPFEYSASFELREEAKEVPFYDDNFYDNYRSVGSYPEVALTDREVKIRLLKSFFGFIEPVV